MNNFGIPVIGLGSQTSEYNELPLQWMPHIQVADVANSVSLALSLGGRELMHGKDESGTSQWAVLLDPNGAAFGLIPVVEESMLPQLADKTDDELAHMGSIAWLDLTVDDASATRDFYCSVVGWRAEDAAMKAGDESYADFNMLNGDGQAIAGICHARGVNVGLPHVWLLYLPVDDLAASLTHVVPSNGKIINQSTNKAGDVTQALVEDPVGSCVVLVQA